MLTPEDASFITTATENLATPLYEALDHGYTAAHSHYDDSGMTGEGFSKGRTDLARDHARRFIEHRYGESLELGGWEPIKNASGRLHLRNGMMTLRLLHATPYDMIPAPGRNKARISYYYNRTVDLFGVQASNLLAVWLSPPRRAERSPYVSFVRSVSGSRVDRRSSTSILSSPGTLSRSQTGSSSPTTRAWHCPSSSKKTSAKRVKEVAQDPAERIRTLRLLMGLTQGSSRRLLACHNH